MSLTIKKIDKLRKQRGKYLDEHGLLLQVFSERAASWFLRYQRKGRERWFGLGPLHAFGLIEARDRARRARALLADGVDPLEQKRAQAARTVTFADTAARFFAAHERSWSPKHHRLFLSSMRTYAYPRLGALPVAEIDEAMVLGVLKPIWHTKTDTAKRVRNRIEKILDYAIAAKLRSGDNPAKWSTLQHLLARPEKIVQARHFAALPYAELPAFMTKVREVSGNAARALEFTILTATRTNESFRARWDEIDFANAVWSIPGARMKMRKEHRVPLSSAALAALRQVYTEDGNEFVFVGHRQGRPISDIGMYRVMRQLHPEATVHGFRSAFSDWAHETTAFPPHVIELALAHAVGNAVERAYRRGDLFDKRRKLMEAWARYCESTPIAKSEIVTPLRSARS